MVRVALWLLAVTTLSLAAAYCRAGIAVGERTQIKGLVDFRVQYFNGTNSWLERGVGQSRFDESHNSSLLLADVALELKSRLDIDSQWIVQAHAYPEQTSGFELTEAYWKYTPLGQGSVRSQYRLGMFYPAVSLENRSSVWTSKYSLNYSAINSWLAEEVRAIGAEGRWSWHIGDAPIPTQGLKLSITGAVYGFNDPTGAVLAWKGWSNHDRQTGAGGTLPLQTTPGLSATAHVQAERYEPFKEIDNRPGFYFGLGVSRSRQFKLEFFHYDNQARDTDFDNGQYAWRTEFNLVSAHRNLGSGLELFSQWMDGHTSMGNGFVHNAFSSHYIGLSKRWGRQRLSFRLEQSRVDDRDTSPGDNNDDKQKSWNVNYSTFVDEHWKLSAEFNWLKSKQGRRMYRGLPLTQKETQLSLSARYYF